jgi:hypothetical protein
LKSKSGGPLYGKRERNVLAKFGRLVFQPVLGEKHLQLGDYRRMRRLYCFPDLGAQGVRVGGRRLGIVTGGIDGRHHGE